MIEVVSPENKDGRNHLRQFVDKAVGAIWQGVHLLAIDLHPPASCDPNGIHEAMWEDISGSGFELPPDRPLTLSFAACRSEFWSDMG